jgi:hypothetical protein
MVARNRVRIGLSYRPARLHRQVESIPWNRFLGSLKVLKYRLSMLFDRVVGEEMSTLKILSGKKD